MSIYVICTQCSSKDSKKLVEINLFLVYWKVMDSMKYMRVRERVILSLGCTMRYLIFKYINLLLFSPWLNFHFLIEKC